MKKQIYCAGPFYSPEDRFQLEEVASTLSKGRFSSYIPHEHVLYKHYLEILQSNQKKKDILSRSLFACNLYNLIELCDGVVFTLNGRVPDEGGNITAAISFITGKTVILYKNDFRSKIEGDDNAMITGMSYGFKNIKRLENVPKILTRVMKKMDKQNNNYDLPLNIKAALEFGKTVEDLLKVKNVSHLDTKIVNDIITRCEKSDWYNKYVI